MKLEREIECQGILEKLPLAEFDDPPVLTGV